MFNVYANGQPIYFPLDDELTIHSPKISLEMGKAGSFQFNLPPTNRYYDRLQKLKTIITVEYDGTEIFRGRVLTINRAFNKVKKIYCEGDLAYLVDSVQKGEKYTGTTHDLFRRIVANHNARMEPEKRFEVGNITIENREIFISGTSDEIEDLETGRFDYRQIAINSMVDEWSTTLDYIQNTIIDYCGGYLRTRRVDGVSYLDLVANYGGTSLQRIEFGTNLIDFTEEVKAEDVFTVLIPLGEDNLTIASINNGSDELVDVGLVDLYGRIVKTHVFESVTDPSTLYENGLRMLHSHENMPITFTVKAVDMHLVDNSAGKILIGDQVWINSIPHNITQYLVCTKIEYDLENHANDTYTFGNPKQTMTERYKKDKAKQEKSSKGHGGRGGGGAAGAAVEDAEDFAVSNSQKTANEFFDAWINVDKEAGHIDLGALYQKVLDNNATLKRTVGIDLDAPTGVVDIFSMNNTLNAHGVSIGKNEAHIKTVANDLESQVALTATWQRDNVDALAGITIRTNNNESSISAVTKYVNEYKSDIESITYIRQRSTENYSLIDSLVKYKDKYNSDITGISQIRREVNSHSTTLTSLNTFKTETTTAIGAIQQKQTATESSLNSLNIFATNAGISISGLEQKASASESKFETFARFVTDTSASLTSIRQTADKDRANIELNASHIGNQGIAIASIKLLAEGNKSAIELKADKIKLNGLIDKVDALEGKFKTLVTDTLKAGFTSSGRINASDIFCNWVNTRDLNAWHSASLNNLNVSGFLTKGGNHVATEVWVQNYVKEALKGYASASHHHTVSTGHYHQVTIGNNTYTSTGMKQGNNYISTFTTSGPV